MDKEDPLYLRLLEKAGVNTTKLRWRLYQLEQKADRVKNSKGVPGALQWMRYGHKICAHCGAVNDHAERVCNRCEQRLPSMFGYRAMRFLSILFPRESPVTLRIAMGLMVLFFLAQLVVDGPSGFWTPSNLSMWLFGSWSNGIPRFPAADEWWRLFSFGLVHAGIIHIGFNTYAANVLGPLAEQQLGRRRMLVLITFAQLGAALATHLWYGNAPFNTMGASGWVTGLLGFDIAFFYLMGEPGRMYRQQLTQWAIFILLFGVFAGANNAAHIGGFVFGGALGLLSGGMRRTSPTEERLWDAGFWASLILWVVVLGFVGRHFITYVTDVTKIVG
jgi:membrane associated rhomboid family serine protease